LDISKVTSVITKAKKYEADTEYFTKNKEGKFENDVRDLLHDLGTLSFHIPENTKKNVILPDSLFFINKDDDKARLHAYFIEFKRNRQSRLSDIQRVSFNILFNNIKVENFVCENWPDFINILKSLYSL